MDPSLLHQRTPTSRSDALDESETGANNHPDLEPTVDVQEYRELEIEQPKPPLRLRMDPPLEFDGEKYGELIFDFDSMIGKDFQRAEREFTRLYKPDKNEMVLPEMKHLYHAIIAAHRANVPLGVILKLPRRYYTPLRLEVLKACGSSPEGENE